jgi:hypothetical protein
VRAASAHDDSPNAAAAADACLSFAPVDGETPLKGTSSPVGSAVVSYRRPAVADRAAQNSSGLLEQSSRLPSGLAAGRERVDAGVKQDFVSVDITQTGNQALVQQ